MQLLGNAFTDKRESLGGSPRSAARDVDSATTIAAAAAAVIATAAPLLKVSGQLMRGAALCRLKIVNVPNKPEAVDRSSREAECVCSLLCVFVISHSLTTVSQGNNLGLTKWAEDREHLIYLLEIHNIAKPPNRILFLLGMQSQDSVKDILFFSYSHIFCNNAFFSTLPFLIFFNPFL